MAKKHSWTAGSVFGIQLPDGRFAVGQVVAHEANVLNCVSVALFDTPVRAFTDVGDSNISDERAFSVVFTSRDLLDSGVWRVAGFRPVSIRREHFPYESLRHGGYVGAKVVGSSNIREFVDAYFGFVIWDDWSDPEYLDRLLLPSRQRPTEARLKGT